jgi:dTDP-4-amino-4,6-dideoxygalactose transaminase
MKVPYLGLQSQFEDERIREAVKSQLDGCQFILGPEVEEFEKRFARLCNTHYAIGVNSGTDALFLALKALGIGPGDEVITVPNSFVATAGAIIAAGARPVFVDVGPDYNMDPGRIENALTPRTRCILPVHMTGNPADMLRIMEIARKHGLHVVEDAAQSAGASIQGQVVGSFGDAGCFSLHPLKNLNVCGDAGAVTTKSDEIREKIRLLRNHGLKNRDEIECFGYNSRMDSIQAAVANVVMDHLEEVAARRITNAGLYDRGLAPLREWVTVPPRRQDVRQVFHTYVVQVARREELIDFLLRRGVETKIHYPVPIHLQKPCCELGYREGDFPVCEVQAQRILSLPVHQYLKEEQILHVIRSMEEFYGS